MMQEYQEKERLYQFLMGLDPNFTIIKTQILATKPTPSLGTAYHLVAEDERQREISIDKSTPPESVAFKAIRKRDKNFNSSKQRNFPRSIKEIKENDHCVFVEEMDIRKKNASS